MAIFIYKKGGRAILETSERRMTILKILCRRRHETIGNLAQEFEVSERTIRRDIESLSLTEPIYTRTGRYNGGIYVVAGYSMYRMYFKPEELEVMNKILRHINHGKELLLSEFEKKVVTNLVEEYTKPKINKDKEVIKR